jgi:hypothetical protein
MFGTIVTNSKLLNEKDKQFYQRSYCGLCINLGKNHGEIARITLNYDMTFIAILLMEVYKEKYKLKEKKCGIHLFKNKKIVESKMIDYVADMNIIVSYYNLIDDWKDDKNIIAYSYSKILEKEFNKVCEKYPEKILKLKKSLERLNNIEKQNIINPDEAAEYCGEFISELFVPYLDEKYDDLKKFGKSIGKFIYILDACIDYEKDIKHKKYNPLIQNNKAEFNEILNLLMAECLENYKKLKISNNIIENILYSGIWTKYDLKKCNKRKEKICKIHIKY